MSRQAKSHERGQAVVEVALVLPVLLVMGLLLVQAAIVMRDQIAVVHAAREAARAAGRDPDPAPAAQTAAEGAAPGARADVGPRQAGQLVRVTVSRRTTTDVPVVGPMLPDPVLSARSAAWVEP